MEKNKITPIQKFIMIMQIGILILIIFSLINIYRANRNINELNRLKEIPGATR